MMNVGSEESDGILLGRWGHGDLDAGKVLYRRYFDIVYRFFQFKASGSVEDLTQTTMEVLSKSHGRFRGQGASFRAFVLGIARNTLLRHLRDQYRDPLDLDPLEHSQRDVAPSPFDVAATRQTYKRLVKALRAIPIDHQIVLELYYWENLSSIEIGAVLGIPPSTIRYRHQRACAALRQELETVVVGSVDVDSTMGGLARWAREFRDMAYGASPSS